MKIVVGCPVRDRAWVLPSWFDYVEHAFAKLELDPIYAFAIGSSEDDTETVIFERAPEALLTFTYEAPYPVSDSRWTIERFTDLANARNALLNLVRAEEPDFFLSLDSDILLHKKTLPQLLESYESSPTMVHNHGGHWSAVGGKCYMMPAGHHTPSYAFNKAAGGLVREDSEGVFQVEILMAIKLMDPDAYHVDYAHSDKGEDVAWSIACRNAGLKLGWDGRTANKHVMLRRNLYTEDPRCGY